MKAESETANIFYHRKIPVIMKTQPTVLTVGECKKRFCKVVEFPDSSAPSTGSLNLMPRRMKEERMSLGRYDSAPSAGDIFLP